jgi:hypothetical protein
LSADDLVAAADSAWWLGDTDQALADYEAAFACHVDVGQPAAGARVAMEIGYLCSLRGDVVGGSGWVAGAGRLLSDRPGCVEHGYLLALEIDDALTAPDYERAIAVARRVQDLAVTYDDQILCSAGLVGEGVAW